MNAKISILVGGQWHAFDLARELYLEGYLHRLITTYPKFRTRQWGIPDDKVVSLPLTLLLNKLADKISGERLTVKLQAFLCRLFAQTAIGYLEGSSLIQGWSSFSEPALNWAKQYSVPFVLYRGSAHITVQSQILKSEYRRLGLIWHETHPEIVTQELREYDLADRVSVPSLFVKRSFLSQGFPKYNLFHNTLGANLKTFFPGVKQDDIFRVVYAGSLSVRKGIHYLVRGFNQANIANSELCLVGSATVETHVLLAEADKQVKCIGQVSQKQLVNYYQNSSVFVMPSIEEGLATVQAQALACGLPLICTANTGGEDLLRMSAVEPVQVENNILEYPAGYLVPAGDSQAIASCLKVLANDVKLYKLKQAAALSLRDADLSWNDCAKRAIKLYNLLINY